MDIDRILNLPRADHRVTPPKMPPYDDKIPVIIDRESFAEFTVSRHLLTSISDYLAYLFATPPSSNGNTALPDDPIGAIISKTGTRNEKLYLTKLKVCDFQDFLRWLTDGHILPHHYGYDQITIVASASRIIRALDIGIMLESNAYVMAAMNKFHVVGAFLERPEEFVNEIFTSTRQMANHPARRMIVAIVAAKTMVKGRRAVCDSGEKRIERGERLKSGTFWGLWDEYFGVRKGERSYPETFEKAVLWGGYKQ